ncbi:hypothetical protein, conserved [Angomonas deanei]|uniref:Uncharacterized protein n=1 Tax=Angomonas deanei TaxID=59799 RepID=A0A7G2C8B6_9TRYP|nr:hypothetical protein, conserved [Angomonas deanei]
MKAAAHLYLQFSNNYCGVVRNKLLHVDQLQEKQQLQLSSVLESKTINNMIVNSSVTKNIILQHEKELLALQNYFDVNERKLELQLKSDILAVLKASAPDAIKALSKESAPTSPSSTPVTVSKRRLESISIRRYNAVTNISEFVTVPAQTIQLTNPFLAKQDAKLLRSADPLAQTIVLDVSPLSSLKECVSSCCETDGDNSRKEEAACEHLMRLAHTKTSMLLLIGSEEEALALIRSIPSCELLLSGSCKDGFTPLKGHDVLKVLFTTRLWGANVILLCDRASGASGVMTQCIHDVLNLSSSWNIDMLSVGILGANPIDAVKSGPPSPAMLLVSEVLRQLRSGISKVVLERSGVKLPQLWTVQDEELLSRDYWDDGVHSGSIPLAVGARQHKGKKGKGMPMGEVRFNSTTAIRVFLPLRTEAFHSRRKVNSPSNEDTTAANGENPLVDLLRYIFGDAAVLL